MSAVRPSKSRNESRPLERYKHDYAGFLAASELQLRGRGGTLADALAALLNVLRNDLPSIESFLLEAGKLL